MGSAVWASLLLLLIQCCAAAARTVDRVAIIGGGFAGLACAEIFSQTAKSVTVFDPRPPGCALASSASAGIMHPMSPKGKVIWSGLEGMEASLRLLNRAEAFAGGRRLVDRGLRLQRLLFSEKEVADWAKSADKHPDLLQMLSPAEVAGGDRLPVGGALIKQAAVVHSAAYLQALWACTCEETDARWEKRAVRATDLPLMTAEYDVVVVAGGAGSLGLWEGQRGTGSGRVAKLGLVRGQNLLYPMPEGGSLPTDTVLLSGEYVVPFRPITCGGSGDVVRGSGGSGGDISSIAGLTHTPHLICGSTHEHISLAEYTAYESQQTPQYNSAPDLPQGAQARAQLAAKIQRLSQLPLGGAVLGSAGVRVVAQRCSQGRLPLLGRAGAGVGAEETGVGAEAGIDAGAGVGTGAVIAEKLWLLTGLGSRGLIHHALLAESLHRAVTTEGDPLSHIPPGVDLE
ncbi:hypothetical protein B484DRAFT_448268 [Ochromonadaceae sp. CCMP2298]|nr:hypothetical protein B484DRAFT_448268 [Ochromonadaceae sp. CCMP2298]